jgi:hypothetical protein
MRIPGQILSIKNSLEFADWGTISSLDDYMTLSYYTDDYNSNDLLAKYPIIKSNASVAPLLPNISSTKQKVVIRNSQNIYTSWVYALAYVLDKTYLHAHNTNSDPNTDKTKNGIYGSGKNESSELDKCCHTYKEPTNSPQMLSQILTSMIALPVKLFDPYY